MFRNSSPLTGCLWRHCHSESCKWGCHILWLRRLYFIDNYFKICKQSRSLVRSDSFNTSPFLFSQRPGWCWKGCQVCTEGLFIWLGKAHSLTGREVLCCLEAGITILAKFGTPTKGSFLYILCSLVSLRKGRVRICTHSTQNWNSLIWGAQKLLSEAPWVSAFRVSIASIYYALIRQPS